MLKLEKSFGKLDIKFKNNQILKFYQEGSSKAIIPNTDESLNQMILFYLLHPGINHRKLLDYLLMKNAL